MKKNPQARYKTQATAIRALGHHTRLMILAALSKKEICVCDLTALSGSDISTVSRHLLVLRRAGFIASRREGKKIYYRLKTRCAFNFAACLTGLTAGKTTKKGTIQRS